MLTLRAGADASYGAYAAADAAEFALQPLHLFLPISTTPAAVAVAYHCRRLIHFLLLLPSNYP